VAEGQPFFAEYWPGARAVSDTPKFFYDAFGRARGGMLQMFGPQVWARGAEAATKGHFIGKPVGDPWVMPGAFLVEGERIRWAHHFEHAGDHPDWHTIPALAHE
jgi:hypothetical protein